MSKRKKIEPGEEFQLDNRIFSYSIGEDRTIKLKQLGYSDEKVKITKSFVPPTIDEVKGYFAEKGYSAEGAQKAFDYYTAGDWKDSGGKQVKNWKQKVLGVWMRPEYLIKTTAENSFKFQE